MPAEPRISHLVPGTPEEADKAHTHSQHLDRRRGSVIVIGPGNKAQAPCVHTTRRRVHTNKITRKNLPPRMGGREK